MMKRLISAMGLVGVAFLALLIFPTADAAAGRDRPAPDSAYRAGKVKQIRKSNRQTRELEKAKQRAKKFRELNQRSRRLNHANQQPRPAAKVNRRPNRPSGLTNLHRQQLRQAQSRANQIRSANRRAQRRIQNSNSKRGQLRQADRLSSQLRQANGHATHWIRQLRRMVRPNTTARVRDLRRTHNIYRIGNLKHVRIPPPTQIVQNYTYETLPGQVVYVNEEEPDDRTFEKIMLGLQTLILAINQLEGPVPGPPAPLFLPPPPPGLP